MAITHKQILEDLKQKAEKDKIATLKHSSFEKVYKGEEPDDILKEISLAIRSGKIQKLF